ncbi:hypothetical protein JRQ81_017066 [Phrynocephalus forsythii]|uniref:Reverse transcriptase Ty1/copia-type domain-containing protein n=1 Tax=Phrynocephalus forsythii TaxID=171643 RepID=A0A9Q1B1W8_9SAUR|nr:hypothetical protein JRQ81_017066 [Phrynocephalus forsythii]
MEQPDGFTDKKHPEHVCKLQKGLYVLKKAVRTGHSKLNEMLLQQGFVQGEADPSLYTRSRNDLMLLFWHTWMTSSSQQVRKKYTQLVHRLSELVEIEELGIAMFYLGIQIQKEQDRSYLLRQKQKILELLSLLDMQEAKSVPTPMQTYFLKNQWENDPLPPDNQCDVREKQAFFLPWLL